LDLQYDALGSQANDGEATKRYTPADASKAATAAEKIRIAVPGS
jgi:hypothetical protein